MDGLLWVLQWLLAAVFLMVGAMKLLAPGALAEQDMNAWIKREGVQRARTAGGFEVLGALGLVLPGLVGVAQVLTPLAALGLVVVMGLAAITVHRPNDEPIIPNVVLGGLALVVAIGRFVEPS